MAPSFSNVVVSRRIIGAKNHYPSHSEPVFYFSSLLGQNTLNANRAVHDAIHIRLMEASHEPSKEELIKQAVFSDQ